MPKRKPWKRMAEVLARQRARAGMCPADRWQVCTVAQEPQAHAPEKLCIHCWLAWAEREAAKDA